ESLEKQLQKCDPDKVKLIVTDGVFSMEGDVANLPEIVRLAKKYNASVMVDEAHGIGVFGEGGRGTCNHFGVTDDVDLVMGTFSKSFASLGGFIATDKEITNFLRHHSRSYIFTASITPASTAAALKALEIMQTEPERQEKLWEVTNFALEGFRNMGCEIGNTSTPIIPLFIRDNFKTFAITRDLFEEGIFVNPVVSPAVAPHDTLIRFSLMATHTHEQVTTALEKIEKVFKAHNVIS
ncbi:MAG: aminotransferase class I/II-fold pyridoxal phosphate-dependent enzyme, partial [Bacteroidales bacterium]|nr:aminotransferase class I/II-fold pyridoxal phosphate-dependent enzyme [Bacteroidales bacterium]